MTYIDPSKPYGLYEYFDMTTAPEGAKKFPSQITIFCDACAIERTGDYVVHDHMTNIERYDVARAHLNAETGWRCDDTGDFCSRCKGGAV